MQDDLQSLEHWLQHLETLHPGEIELGLDRVRVVAEQASLMDGFPPIVTVGGTNGKGSVVEYLMRCYAAAGLRTGAYTSPHLHRFNERIRIDTREVPDAELVKSFALIEAARHEVALTYFEFTTLAAMQLFREQELDLIILEVGLGGRLDAVNLWSATCSVITSVGIDHQDWLGSDRETIAGEKVAIARSGQPLVIGERDRPAAIDAYADDQSVPLYRIGDEFDVDYHRDGEGSLSIKLPDQRTVALPLPELKGPHQRANAAVAVCVIHLLAQFTGLPDLPVASIAAGLAAANLRGRLQQIRVGQARVVLDVAHNPAAAIVLRDALREHFAGEQEGYCIAVFAMLKDKDIEGVIDALGPLVKCWFCAGLPVDRALPASEAAAFIKVHYPRVEVREFEDVRSALDTALQQFGESAVGGTHSDSPEEPTYVLVFGSFFTVGDALTHLDQI